MGDINAPDRWVWHFAKDGKYSVKSAYHLQVTKRRNGAEQNSGDSSGVSGEDWSQIWKLNLPPKVRMFVWRACKNSLPHAVEMVRRHIGTNPFCINCKVKLETMAHILMECRGRKEIWSSTPFQVPQWNSHDRVWLLFRRMKDALPHEELLVGLVIWWKSWEIRNKEIYGVEEGVPSDVVQWSREYLALYQESQIKPPPPEPEVLPSIWVPPDPGFIKVNVDVAYPENADFIRVGMVAKNEHGVTKWWARKEITGRPPTSDGEARALMFGLHTAIKHGWNKIILETDCLPVHKYLTLPSSELVSFGAILDTCISLRTSFSSLLFSFVRRSGNSHAHLL